MRCEDVRPVLAELAEGGLREAGDIERHLAGCPTCSADLARYRAVVLGLNALRGVLTDPPEGFLGRVLAEIPESQWRAYLHRVVADDRLQHAVLSLGGAVVGATAIGLLWWRAARRTMSEPAPRSA